ncbi:hypothetical protein CVS30_03850 [Arthrobacter psychrolactophilus]|uniref:Uncharacterized protein n=1 Tax=Arthrobacter psychrolactophilus TaxID=92442 RepID=A0A2V5IZA3_9MICC|nr:hypothetical protein [Arthrobacter psychrolactophilus]PYI39803.1 hypothetical protein CVS30_03850 [Arthrobacter psychrolactophilus]
MKTNDSSFFHWAQSVHGRRDEMDQLLTNPVVCAIIANSSTAKGRLRTPALRLMCGKHWSGVTVSLRIESGRVAFDYAVKAGAIGKDHLQKRSIKGYESVPMIRVMCMECGREQSRQPEWMVKESVQKLADLQSAKSTRPELVFYT